MTTGTGAFGLNIPAASRVFILEPQWNPSVEEQAIARTTRLDQKAKVTVIRYRIEQTIEMVRLSGLSIAITPRLPANEGTIETLIENSKWCRNKDGRTK